MSQGASIIFHGLSGWWQKLYGTSTVALHIWVDAQNPIAACMLWSIAIDMGSHDSSRVWTVRENMSSEANLKSSAHIHKNIS